MDISIYIPQNTIAITTVLIATYSILKVTFEVIRAKKHRKKWLTGKGRARRNKIFDVFSVVTTPIELAYNAYGLSRHVVDAEGNIKVLAVACVIQQLTALLYKWACEISFIRVTWRKLEQWPMKMARKSMRYAVILSSTVHLYCRVYSGTYTRVASFIQLLGGVIITGSVISAITRVDDNELKKVQKRLTLTALQTLGLVCLMGTLIPVSSGDGRVDDYKHWFRNTAECVFILSVVEASAMDLISSYFEEMEDGQFNRY